MKLKQFFNWIYANKKSLGSTITSALLSSAGIYASIATEVCPTIMIGSYDCGKLLGIALCVGVFVVTEFGICGRGFESIVDFLAKTQILKAEAQDKLLTKKAEAQIKKQERELAIAQEQAKLQAQIEAKINQLKSN